MIYLVLGLIGAAAGSLYMHDHGGTLIGAGMGFMLAAVISLRNRLIDAEQRLKALETIVDRRADGPVRAESQPRPPEDLPTRVHAGGPQPDTGAGARIDAATVPTPAALAEIPSLELALADPAGADRRTDATADPADQTRAQTVRPSWGQPVWRWLAGGNLVVRVGVVVLLFGFAFLVKYAAARNLVPLEARLSVAFIAGIGLLLLGWRLRENRFAYAVTLQGGGIGVMYLVLFASARLFHLVPMPLVLGLMIGLVAFSGVLAVLQNAAAMAVIGAAGGFMAPVLLSTGSGSHVMLFSYYGLLNTGIFGIAWFRSWRWLNLVGFVFTFGIGSAWGIQYYHRDYFASTEPFLVIYFLFYLAIAVLFARRQPPQLKGYVDGTLVFGLPLAVFSLQAALVAAMPYGLAFSAMGMGLIYTGLSTALWRRCEAGMRTLVEAFLALGVIFGSLAIPLALSGSWTAVTWSLEGAGLVWIGLRQHRWMARTFGVLLQIGAGLLFLSRGHGDGLQLLVINSRFLGGMMMGLAGLFSAFVLERGQRRLYGWERRCVPVILAWGLVWWIATGLMEIDRGFSSRFEWPVSLSFIGLSALAMGLGYQRLNWKGMAYPVMGLLPVMVLTGAALTLQSGLRHPFQSGWSVVWPGLLAVHVYLLRVMDSAWPKSLRVAWHTGGVILAAVLLSWEAGWHLDRLADGARVWEFIAWGGVPATALWATKRFGRRLKWPSDAWSAASRGWIPLLLSAGLMGWTILGLALSGNPEPLPYLPLLNPLDLAQAFIFLTVAGWIADAGRKAVCLPMGIEPHVLWTSTAGGVFLWLTAVVARSVHAFSNVPYTMAALSRSDMFQAAVSVLWGGMALGAMVAASRRRHRVIWFAGAGLLAVVVIKLFIVDLSGSGTISRIVSFLAVGVLMLIIGFFTPLPPAAPEGQRS